MAQTFLGISTFAYPFLSGRNPEQRPEHPLTPFMLIDKAVELGLKCVQFADNLPFDDFDDATLDAIRDYGAEKGVYIENGMRGMTPEHLRRYIHICQRMDVHLLRAIPAGIDFSPSVDEIVAIIRDALPLLEQYDITLGIENYDRFLTAECAEMVRRVAHPLVGLIVDSTNSLSREEPIEQVLANMSRYCVGFHVKDYTFCRSNFGVGLAVIGQPAGQGRQQISYGLGVLKRDAPRAFSTVLESWMPACETTEQSLAQEEQWAKESIEYLKQYVPTQLPPNYSSAGR